MNKLFTKLALALSGALILGNVAVANPVVPTDPLCNSTSLATTVEWLAKEGPKYVKSFRYFNAAQVEGLKAADPRFKTFVEDDTKTILVTRIKATDAALFITEFNDKECVIAHTQVATKVWDATLQLFEQKVQR